MENVWLFFLFSLNRGLPTPLVFVLDVCQSVVMALNSCICLCVCEYMSVSVSPFACVLGCPSSIGLSTVQHSTRGPGAVWKCGSVKEREAPHRFYNWCGRWVKRLQERNSSEMFDWSLLNLKENQVVNSRKEMQGCRLTRRWYFSFGNWKTP